jgi:hypothetical protein
MHTALIFKEQAKVKAPGFRENGIAQPHYSIQKIYIPQSLRQRLLSWYHEYLLHPGQTRTEKAIMNTMIWPGLTQDVENGLFMFHLSSMSNDKEGAKNKKYGLLSPKTAESNTISLGHGLCGSGGSHPFTIRKTSKTHSVLALTMIDPAEQ